MNRIKLAFNSKAVISYLIAGDPDVSTTVEYIIAMEKAGATLIHLGIPFSDPIAEDSEIQESNICALSNGMTIDQVFEIVKEVRKTSNIAICLMTYLNPIFNYGYDDFFNKCKDAGVDGIIIPDCPFEENKEVRTICDKYGVALISMVTDNSRNRALMISKNAKGYIYLIANDDNVDDVIAVIKTVSNLPIAIVVDNLKQINNYQGVDGVILEKEVIKIIKESNKQGHQSLYDFIYLIKQQLL